MVLSATTASKHPKDNLDFFPLTVDVEERMYAAGRIPGSFFRREGRPSEDAILTCRLIDRPLRPSFAKGLRNEIQVVETIMALHPDHLYDVVAINAASLSTQLSGIPFSGPIGGVRVALIKGQWVGFPNYSQLEEATFDMVVAGRVLADGEVAIMMVEASPPRPRWRCWRTPAAVPSPPTRRRSPRDWRRPSRSSARCARARPRSPGSPPRRPASSRSTSTTARTSSTPSRPRCPASLPRR
jgi:polyribonucleotide nucleotidyltransferase